MGSRIIQFPADAYCGRLWGPNLQSIEEGEEFGEARGDVFVPTDKRIELWVDTETALLSLPLLANLPADSFDSVSLACTNATDADLRYLTHFTCLRGLALWETRIGDEALLLLKSFPQLESLDIGDTNITDFGLHHLRSLSALRDLSLPNTAVGNLGMEPLADLKKLKTLGLSNTKVNDDGIAYLSSLSELRYLSIYETGITEKGYSELKRNLPACKIGYFESNDL